MAGLRTGPLITRLGGVLTVAIAAGACNRPSADNIQLWKTTEKGPARLAEAVADRDVAPRLRAEAAAALVDIGRADEADTIIAQIPAGDRIAVITAGAPIYEAAMRDPAPDKALAARDALFSLRRLAQPDVQKQIDGALLPAIEADLVSGKLQQGRHSIDKMLSAIGAGAVDTLVRVLATPAAPYAQAAALLGKIGDEAARDRGAAALIARAPAIHAADKAHPELLFKALGDIGGPGVVKHLEAEVGAGRAAGSKAAAHDEALLATRALGERRDPAVVPFAIEVAADAGADKAIRDEMFGVIETIGGLDAEKGLLGIISSDRDEIVRYRAFEAVLAARRADGLVAALEAFPASATYKKVDVDDLMVKLIEKLGASARPALAAALGSRAPLARMTAVMALEQMGGPADVPRLEKLAGDSTLIKGFPAGDSVGKEASAAAAAVKTKS